MKRPKIGRTYWMEWEGYLHYGRCIGGDETYTVFKMLHPSGSVTHLGMDNKELAECLRCEGVDWWWLRLWRWLFAPAELEQGDW